MTQTLDIAPLILWVGALSALFAFGNTIWSLFASPVKRAEAKIEELAAAITRLDLRIQRIEDRVETVPTIEALHHLELTLSQTRGELAVVVERLKPLGQWMSRLETWILEQNK
jgi:hypothetical protein